MSPPSKHLNLISMSINYLAISTIRGPAQSLSPTTNWWSNIPLSLPHPLLLPEKQTEITVVTMSLLIQKGHYILMEMN